MKKINCIILDDEPFAVKLLADYASKVPRLNVLYADSDVFKAIEILNNESVDLVFIDIQMPQLTGLELMQMFNQKHNFIITSAYPEYALDVFQFHVIDYLLKPIVFNRFYQSVEKFIRWQETFQNLDSEDYLFVKADRKHHKIATDHILYIEGLKDYIRIHTKDEKIMVLENMKDILEKLPLNQFVRIHRSFIIPKNKIKVIEGNQIKMTNGEFLPIGETYRKLISDWLS
ncbi:MULTISPECIES: LytR/AlgR family response regulator transcription factor [Flavobacterium]|jgi:DNA-binding LytR/AlgR family response regulator|uniref:Two component transcriptional regulator, LytTR family n=1 Tax=Flavobacterium johnsoniae (strain ATCC 17061 / DSM 2064 / JCM 8514 / BCRC 14874 / CCUG 350202 / NBRC 14942 / NCIMB 11054 / UW101) TaxID=376686 RepID=A5FCU0_FLAJ1|nr:MULTISPECIES: LytTR family DNA-binding domain-containing protein [Flavobacterium]ABQ06978.1 two component transcriptional regulator, LytTR family [Flavobacterium johnsoniae UW101]OXE98704.1 DNA-binding response regulator [Flavobacterium johnsoniae UW101]WDF57698.1 LytTR family DNA-binding domain-containing protein [Flavobacterium sp. KACC 22758]WQG81187.1 LytTR family DNA-binding domain-containing protein [Flavobacterium johnsoniae UW101]SHL34408.1 two component transcriptional regulator, L